MKQGIVNANFLNFRATPGGVVIDVLDSGETLEVLRSVGSWLQVKVESAIGYVASRYIKMLPERTAPSPKNVFVGSNESDQHLGVITAGRLNVRDKPNGFIINVIGKGKTVNILDRDGAWLKVNYQGRIGFVSSAYVRIEKRLEAKPETLQEIPIVDEHHLFRYEDNKAIAPNGAVFGRKFRKGLYNYGTTSISDFINQSNDLIQTISQSRLRVMDAVSENEGKFEAVNTWDNAFLSIGLFQWTAGVGADAGELSALLQRFKHNFPQDYENYFGRYGLEPINVSQISGNVSRGYLSLNGAALSVGAQKETLRHPFWAHQCWLAGQNKNFQLSQLVHAVSRIDCFYSQDKRKIHGRWVSEYIRSEFGVAQLLDQHVNRPAHVPLTLTKAIDSIANQLDIDNPNTWGDEEEQLLLERYLNFREQTSMTDSKKRELSIRQNVALGKVSDKRGSFV